MAAPIQNNIFSQIREAQARLASQGIGAEELDAILQERGVDNVLADMPVVAQYFRQVGAALTWLINKYDPENPFYSVAGQVPGVENYREYFTQADSSQGQALEDYLPPQYFQDPQLLLSDAGLSATQVEAFKKLFGLQGAQRASTASSSYPAGASATPLSKNMSMPGMPTLPSSASGSLPATAESIIANEPSYLNQFIGEDNMFYGPFMDLFETDAKARAAMANIAAQLRNNSQMKSEIHRMMAGLDPTNPEDAKKLQILQAQLGDVDMDQQEAMMMMKQIQEAKNQAVQLFKGLMDQINKTFSGMIQNMRS